MCIGLLLMVALFLLLGFSVVNITVQQDGFASGAITGIAMWLYAVPILGFGRPRRLLPRSVRDNPRPSAARWWALGCFMLGLWAWLFAAGNASNSLLAFWPLGILEAVVIGVTVYGLLRGVR